MNEKLRDRWNSLTKPNMAVQDDDKRLKVRLFLSLLLLVIPVAAVGFVIPFLLKPASIQQHIAVISLTIISFALLVIIYLSAQYLPYRVIVGSSLGIGILAIVLTAIISAPPANIVALYYLLVIVLVSGLFFLPIYSYGITAVALALILILPYFVPELSYYEVLSGPFPVVLTGSAANLFIIFYRRQFEKGRREDISNLLKTSRQRADQLAALNQTLLDIVSHRDLGELLEAITARAANLLGTTGGSIYLVDDDKQVLTLTAVHKLGKELLGSQLKKGQGMAGRVWVTGQPLAVSDYTTFPGRSATIPPDMLGSVIQVPIILANKVIGVISCQEIGGVIRDFTKNDHDMLMDLAQQSALALQNAYLFKEEQTAREHAERLQAATLALSSSLILQDVLDNILEELQKVVPYDSASVQQIKEKTYLEIVGGHGFADVNKLLGIKFNLTTENNPNQQVIETRTPIILADVPSLFPRYKEPPFNETIIHSWLGVPLLFGEQIIGMLALDKKEVGFYTPEHAHIVSAFASQAAVAIENARLYEERRQRAFELETLAEISASLRIAQTVPDMLPILLEKAVEAVNASYGVLFLLDPESGKLVSRYSAPAGVYQAGFRQTVGQGITGHVAKTREVHISNDVANDPMLNLAPGESESFAGTVSAISLPLQAQDQLIGVMHIGSNQKRQFSEADVRLLTAVSNIAANALNRASVMDTLEERVNERTQALAEANARLHELDQLKTKFISDISHELRTPIATLNLYMDLLDRGKEENKAKYMDVLRQKTDQLVRLTEDILNISRLNLYEGTLEFTAVNLNDTITIVMAMNQERAQANDLQLIFKPSPEMPHIRAERNQLLQAINNILTNALDFTLQGSVTVRTYISNDAISDDAISDDPAGNGKTACLEIIDTGIGIPADELPHIFERFYRGHNIAQLNIPGTGLGLTIAKEIMDLHNGKIEIESQPGTGSTIRLLWPLLESVPGPVQSFRKD